MRERLITLYQKRKWEIILLFAIIAMGIFFRTYNFSDWLLFEVDQSYDTLIVSQAVENGIENLPLLGPTAGGGRALRLGPAFYYMEYASALVFGDTPTGHAMLVLIFSILSLPLFYLFCRRYFSVPLSLSLLALFSGSVFLILYGRFSWSPNVLPFLTLSSFYFLLRSVSLSESEKQRNLFFLLAVTAITIASQIHFNSFFTIPTIVVLFLLYKRPKFPWRTWLMAFGIVAIIYSPMVLSDITTHGENAGFFLKKIAKSGDPFRDAIKKSVVTLQYNASGYFFITTGIDHINGKRIKEYGFQNDANLPWRILAILLLVIQLYILFRAIQREETNDRKDFLILIFLWAFIPFCYFYSLISSNFHFYPRFYLLIAPVAIILFGLLLQKIRPTVSLPRKIILTIITLLLLIPSIRRTSEHFLSFANPGANKTPIEREDIFPNDNRLTQEEQLDIVEFLASIRRENGYPIYLATFSDYEPAFWYHLERKGISFSEKIDGNHLYRKGNYFLIQYPKDGTRIIEKDFTIIDKKKFDVLVVYTLIPKENNIKEEKQLPENKKKSLQTIQIQALTTWKTFLEKKCSGETP